MNFDSFSKEQIILEFNQIKLFAEIHSSEMNEMIKQFQESIDKFLIGLIFKTENSLSKALQINANVLVDKVETNHRSSMSSDHMGIYFEKYVNKFKQNYNGLFEKDEKQKLVKNSFNKLVFLMDSFKIIIEKNEENLIKLAQENQYNITNLEFFNKTYDIYEKLKINLTTLKFYEKLLKQNELDEPTSENTALEVMKICNKIMDFFFDTFQLKLDLHFLTSDWFKQDQNAQLKNRKNSVVEIDDNFTTISVEDNIGEGIRGENSAFVFDFEHFVNKYLSILFKEYHVNKYFKVTLKAKTNRQT